LRVHKEKRKAMLIFIGRCPSAPVHRQKDLNKLKKYNFCVDDGMLKSIVCT
jgi:hypothetical protein